MSKTTPYRGESCDRVAAYASGPNAEVRNREARVLCPDARRLFDLGAASLRAGRFQDARVALAHAAEHAPDHARIRSLLGLSIAYVDCDFEQARQLCESATRQEFFNPEVYLNLARVYLVFGRRSEAFRYLRRGQMIDPGNQQIQNEMAGLGRRGVPMLPFLPRRHPINRALGEARSLIATRILARTAA